MTITNYNANKDIEVTFEDNNRTVAKEEYANGNIIEKCYKSMMNYEVKITD